MTYARARLWIGISAVGSLVVLSAAGLIGNLPAKLLTASSDDLSGTLGDLALFVGAATAMLLPFDLLGGWILPRRFGRAHLNLSAFLLSWLRGVLMHALVLIGSGFVLIRLADDYGWGGGALGFLALTLILFRLRLPLAVLVGRLAPGTQAAAGSVRADTVVAAQDEGFAGGVLGLPGRERIVWPAHWLKRLPAAMVEEVTRRRRAVVRTGSYRRGVWLAVLWNLAGMMLASLLPGAGWASSAELVATALGFTIWSFLGLLQLPYWSQRGVFEADQAALKAGANASTLGQAIQRLDEWQDDEPARSPFVESIFHPIPSVTRRIDRLEQPAPAPKGAWGAARLALFLSWAGLGLLGRAVHCNCGRPDLWVLLPSD